MAAIIHYEADTVWSFFQKEKEKLRSAMKEIAENPEYDVVIYITEEDRGTLMFPNFVVLMDGSVLYEEAAVNENDCEQTCKKIYYEYLTEERLINKVIEADMGESNGNTFDEEEEEEDQEAEIEERESDLNDAVKNFIADVLCDPLSSFVGKDEAEEIYEDFKEHALEYLARKWELSIYRPMILEDEDGEEFFEEYPYDVMEYDDPWNPLYK